MAPPPRSRRTERDDDLRQIASLDAGALERFAAILEKELPCSQSRLRQSLKVLGGDSAAIVRVLAHYLLRAVPGGPIHKRAWEVLSKDLRAVLGRAELHAVLGHGAAFRRIFSERNAILLKGAVLQQRMLPHVGELRTMVELRPVFDEEHRSILGYVPSILVQLSLHSEWGDPTDHTFQATPEEINGLLDSLRDARAKTNRMVEIARESKMTVFG